MAKDNPTKILPAPDFVTLREVLKDHLDKRAYLVWRPFAQEGSDRFEKLPVDPEDGAVKKGNSAKERGILTFAEAEAAITRLRGSGVEVGLGVFAGHMDGVTLGDGDNWILDNQLRRWTKDLLPTDTYVERSPSGTGVRIIFSSVPDVINELSNGHERHQLGFYGPETGRFVTLTGRRLTAETPLELAPMSEDLGNRVMRYWAKMDHERGRPSYAAFASEYAPSWLGMNQCLEDIKSGAALHPATVSFVAIAVNFMSLTDIENLLYDAYDNSAVKHTTRWEQRYPSSIIGALEWIQKRDMGAGAKLRNMPSQLMDAGINSAKAHIAKRPEGAPSPIAGGTVTQGVGGTVTQGAGDIRDTIVTKSDHLETARLFLAAFYDSEGIANWQDVFYRWIGPRWEECLPDEIRHQVYLWLATCCWVAPKRGDLEPAEPTGGWVSEILLALAALTARDGRETFGWDGPPQIKNVLSVENGLLCLDTLTLHPHSSDLFNTVSIAAPWLETPPKFAATAFGQWAVAVVTKPDGTGADQLAMLQEMTGYLISGETRLQKMFLITGPRRSGKGTFGRLLNDLLHGSVSTISSTALQGSFPMQDLIGKAVALLPDVRIDKNTKQGQLAETLLSVSGEDHQTVARKFKSAWSGKLGVRFLLMSNSVPRLRDVDGVLFSRFQFLEFPNSNYGKEDPFLTEKLWEDRAVMLRWAVEGYLRLRQNGHFSPSQTHQRLIDQSLVRMDPVGCFASEYLEVTGAASDQVPMDDLHAVFHSFACDHSITTYSYKGFGKMFWGKDFPGVRPARGHRVVLDGKKVRVRIAQGVRWKKDHGFTATQLAELREDARQDAEDVQFLGVAD